MLLSSLKAAQWVLIILLLLVHPHILMNVIIELCQHVMKFLCCAIMDLQANQRLMVGGPDTTTTCGNPMALLTINEQYVVGVGSTCGAISPWSTLQSYSPNELEMLRAFGRDFQAGSLTCGALTFVSSLPVILSSMALVAMATLFY